MTRDEKRSIMYEVTLALRDVHAKNIVHNRVNDHNIAFRPEVTLHTVFLINFEAAERCVDFSKDVRDYGMTFRQFVTDTSQEDLDSDSYLEKLLYRATQAQIEQRPSITAVLASPAFWDNEKTTLFFNDVSNLFHVYTHERIEDDARFIIDEQWTKTPEIFP